MKTNELNIELTIKTKKTVKFELPFFGKINDTLIAIYDTGTVETFYPYTQFEPGTLEEAFLQKDYFNYSLERELDFEEILERVKSATFNKEITEDDITIYNSSEFKQIKGKILKCLSRILKD